MPGVGNLFVLDLATWYDFVVVDTLVHRMGRWDFVNINQPFKLIYLKFY